MCRWNQIPACGALQTEQYLLREVGHAGNVSQPSRSSGRLGTEPVLTLQLQDNAVVIRY